ncbi:MAG: GTPase [Myxococcota bacterium]
MERVFRARRFEEVLAHVKKELGPDAIILSSRQVPGDPLGPSQIEVKAVSEKVALNLGITPSRPNTRHRHASGMVESELVRAGVPPTAARALSTIVRQREEGEPLSMGLARPSLEAALALEMQFDGPIRKESARVLALVGPTGVGKTTTIAKLAAQQSLIHDKQVGLITIDQYRVGGAEQLERYADLIGVPMEIAHDSSSLEIALRRLEGADLVLVDTAGRSPKDRVALAEMAETLQRVQEPVEVHLCMTAGMRDHELSACIDRHAVLRPLKLLCTKLDEALLHGSIIEAQVLSGLPFSYFTIGQRVPEDIETASAERLASLLSGEEL